MCQPTGLPRSASPYARGAPSRVELPKAAPRRSRLPPVVPAGAAALRRAGSAAAIAPPRCDAAVARRPASALEARAALAVRRESPPPPRRRGKLAALSYVEVVSACSKSAKMNSLVSELKEALPERPKSAPYAGRRALGGGAEPGPPPAQLALPAPEGLAGAPAAAAGAEPAQGSLKAQPPRAASAGSLRRWGQDRARAAAAAAAASESRAAGAASPTRPFSGQPRSPGSQSRPASRPAAVRRSRSLARAPCAWRGALVEAPRRHVGGASPRGASKAAVDCMEVQRIGSREAVPPTQPSDEGVEAAACEDTALVSPVRLGTPLGQMSRGVSAAALVYGPGSPDDPYGGSESSGLSSIASSEAGSPRGAANRKPDQRGSATAKAVAFSTVVGQTGRRDKGPIRRQGSSPPRRGSGGGSPTKPKSGGEGSSPSRAAILKRRGSTAELLESAGGLPSSPVGVPLSSRTSLREGAAKAMAKDVSVRMSFTSRLNLSRVERKIVAQELENMIPQQQIGDPALDQQSLDLLFDRFESGGTVHRKLFPTMIGLMGIRVALDVLQPLAASVAKLAFANKEEWFNFANQYWVIQRSDILQGVFRRYMDDGEVHKTVLHSALEFIHIHVDETWLQEVYAELTRVNTLDFNEFLQFVEAYWRRSQTEYREAFRRCDQDMSGAIDMFELSGLLAALDIMPLETVLAEIFAEVDVDGSGEIEFNEFQTFIRILYMREGFTLSEHNRLRSTFRKFDLDKSGNLDMEEALKTLVYMHYSLSRDQAEAIFKSFSSPSLTEREFILFMRKVREKELNQIKNTLKRLRSNTTKEQALVSLLAQLDHFPDLDAVRECAAEAGVDTNTATLTPEKAKEVNAKMHLHRRLRASLVAEPLEVMKRMSTGTSFTAESRRASEAFEPDLILSMGEAWKFLDVYRSREGLTLARLRDNEAAFGFGRGAARLPGGGASPPGRPSSDGDGEAEAPPPRSSQAALRVCRTATAASSTAGDGDEQGEEEEEEEEECDTRGVRRALRWLGWDLPRSLVLQLIGVVDVDQSGKISLKEFHKLIRMCCERELARIRAAASEVGLSMNDLEARITRQEAVKVLGAMGFNSWRQRFALRCLGFQVVSRLAERFTRKRAAEASLIATATVYQLVQVVRSLNQDIRDTFRQNDGFAPSEVEELKLVFDRYVEESGTGRLTSAIQRKLLEDEFPRKTFPEMDWKALLATIPTIDGTIDFGGFLRLKGHAEDLLEKRREKRELDFIASSEFSPSEVQEFRAVFVAQDPGEKDTLNYETVLSLVSSIFPMENKLRTVLNAVVAENHPKQQSDHLTAADSVSDAASDSDLCDFTDFLRLMQQLLSHDLAALGRQAPADHA